MFVVQYLVESCTEMLIYRILTTMHPGLDSLNRYLSALMMMHLFMKTTYNLLELRLNGRFDFGDSYKNDKHHQHFINYNWSFKSFGTAKRDFTIFAVLSNASNDDEQANACLTDHPNHGFSETTPKINNQTFIGCNFIQQGIQLI